MIKISCYWCGKKGYKGFQCNKKGGKKKPGSSNKDNCRRCGKQGHTTKDCFDDPKNAGKHPSWYRMRSGKSKKDRDLDENKEVNMYCQDVAPEMLLAAADISFPARLELLRDPNVWVANTGASCDSTGHHIHLVN
eukprot:11630004-Ditylum_brightwellii.AAC.1